MIVLEQWSKKKIQNLNISAFSGPSLLDPGNQKAEKLGQNDFSNLNLSLLNLFWGILDPYCENIHKM